MPINDDDLKHFLNKNRDEAFFTIRKKPFRFRIKNAANPIDRFSYDIEFYSDDWEKSLICPPQTTMEFLEVYNSGKRQKKDYKRKTGKQGPSRRGGYLLQIFKAIEKELDKEKS